MFVVFEGIDGSGKTTVSNRVAARLEQPGRVVTHLREDGFFASEHTQAIREFGRDARNLEMLPHTELLIYTAREVQLMDEVARPALERGELVIADRYLYSAQVLSKAGRGLPAEHVDAVVDQAARGLWPDLVVYVDIDPHVARARRRVAKIVTPDPRPSSRKGLTGVGLQHRLVRGYRELAASQPERFVVVDNSYAKLDELVDQVTEIVRLAVEQSVAAAIEHSRGLSSSPAVSWDVPTPEQALSALLQWVDARAEREPGVAAYFLSGLCGADVDTRRESLAERAPEAVAYGLRGMDDELSWTLRERLSKKTPRHAARSLSGLLGESERGYRLREAVCAIAPRDVAASLDRRDSEAAWEFRERLYSQVPNRVVASLEGIDSHRAWQWRQRWTDEQGGEAVVFADYEKAKSIVNSITGIDDDRAWTIRDGSLAQAPVPTVSSIATLTSDRAWELRARFAERATKTVMATLRGSDDERAWNIRTAMANTSKEVLDSIRHMDNAMAWKLREHCMDMWPSSVVKSLGRTATTPRGQDVVARQLARYPKDLSLLKHATSIALGLHDKDEDLAQ